MRSTNNPPIRALLAGAALLIAIPALSQDAPKSLLPPGFGEPDKPAKPDDDTPSSKPTDLLPDVRLNTPGSTTSRPRTASGGQVDPSLPPLDPLAKDGEEVPIVAAVLQDLPASARRSTAQVGILEPDDGDLGAAAFGRARGPFLTHLMRHMRAPIASRWSQILLRRALLSKADTPAGVSGADFVAERAWLLIRLGEAESARQLVQSVDVDQYTPKLFEVAMQASLASADPAGLCSMVEPAMKQSEEPAWAFARAICSALSGESAQASSQIDRARNRGPGQGIDGLLAEKVVGAGGNTRRAVVIEWEPVQQLTAWRFGMATATGLDIPDRLIATVGPHVRAWRARAPLLPVEKRVGDSNVAAALGVLSSDALVDQYGAWADATDPSEASGKPFTLLRTAYAGEGDAARLSALRSLWTTNGLDARGLFARLVLTARASAMITPNEDYIDDAGSLIGSMFTAGLDLQAARWAKLVESGSGEGASRGWGMLAVGAPGKAVDWSLGNIKNYQGDDKEGLRGPLLFAGMAGLGRMADGDISSMAESLSVPVGRQTAWTRALERAVAGRETGTVALLCAVGLQKENWKDIPPVQLFHIVSALRRVGLAGEARMIAAEALSRT
jgi:hypothetical protein